MGMIWIDVNTGLLFFLISKAKVKTLSLYFILKNHYIIRIETRFK